MAGNLTINGTNSQSVSGDSAAGGNVSASVSAFGDRVEISGAGRLAGAQQVQSMQRPPDGPEPDVSGMSQNFMDLLDTDGDGSLSSEEIGTLTGQLEGADSDSDGLVSQDELLAALSAGMQNSQAMAGPGMMAGPPPPPDSGQISAQMISSLDTDGDGSLSQTELGDLAEQLAPADTDSDGLISGDELASAIEAQMQSLSGEEEASGMQQAGPPPPPPPPPAQMDATSMSDQLISQLDTDGDDALSLDELGDLSENFAAADTNGDGVISREELLNSLSSKLDEMGGLPQMGKSGTQELNAFKQMIGKTIEQSGDTSEAESNISRITDLLGELGLSGEETRSVLNLIQNARFDMSA
ncbi:hypothetical protein LLH00_10690 [bacterium]|nr:hypothetical protein [bacterium]